MTTFLGRRRALPSRMSPRALAVAVVVCMAGLLIGLSAARNALPGDTIQLTPRGHTSTISAGLVSDLGTQSKLGPHVSVRSMDVSGALLSVLPRPLTLAADVRVAWVLGAVAGTITGGIVGAIGCRGPPAGER